MTVRTGCDVQHVDDVELSISLFGERYLQRVFTPLERRHVADRADRLAARFAAKEAVLKVLRPGPTDAVALLDIEIVSAPSGTPEVALHGSARALAELRGLDEIAVSLSHDGGVAFATAVAITSA